MLAFMAFLSCKEEAKLIPSRGNSLIGTLISAPKDEVQTQRVKLGTVRLKPGEQQQVEFTWSWKGDAPKALRIDYLEFKKI